MPHSGVAADDDRNASVIEYFRPKPVTLDSALSALSSVAPGLPLSDLYARAERLVEKIARGPVGENPPLSQPLDQVSNAWFGLNTRPDIIEALWRLDDFLPQRCRWVFWGFPALVHPGTGVVFAVAFGTIGTIIRVPGCSHDTEQEHALAALPASRFDARSVGPGWRLLSPGRRAISLVRDAYEFAALPK